MHIDDAEKGLVDITLDHFSDRRVPHYGLNGRATDVYPATSKALGLTEELVAKLYWGEESRTSEVDILQKVYAIAETEPDVKNHVPDMLFSHKFPNSSTAAVRERLNLSTEGSRVLYCIVFRRLERITTLYGDQFLTCWWHTVKCHLALWKRGVNHRDISASNLMWKPGENGPVGVLNDYDLSTTGGSVRGNERTGTVPFMAIDLLSEAELAGKVKHVYAHDLESFIWVLVWVCLRYDKGKVREDERPLDEWGKVDAPRCREKKLAFLDKPPCMSAGQGHERNWGLAFACLMMLRQHRFHSMSWQWSPSQLGTTRTPELETACPKEAFWKPWKTLVHEPIVRAKSLWRNFVDLPPPLNPPWGSVLVPVYT